MFNSSRDNTTEQEKNDDEIYTTELKGDESPSSSSSDIDEKNEKFDPYVDQSQEGIAVEEAKLDDFIHRDEKYDWDSEEFRNIPELVRNTVSFEDDPSMPVITFRAILLSTIFCAIGSVISQIS